MSESCSAADATTRPPSQPQRIAQEEAYAEHAAKGSKEHPDGPGEVVNRLSTRTGSFGREPDMVDLRRLPCRSGIRTQQAHPNQPAKKKKRTSDLQQIKDVLQNETCMVKAPTVSNDSTVSVCFRANCPRRPQQS